MDKTDVWPVIHAQRQALDSDLRSLSVDLWSMRSLCDQWTVRDVAAHMTATAKMTPLTFVTKLAGSGFSFGRLQAADIAREKGATPAETLTRFESVIPSEGHPPGPADTMLGETIVHAEDIRRPLGIRHEYPVDAVVRVADFFKGSNLLIGAKRRIADLTLQATDANWSHGSGPLVSGPVLSLVLAMTGRREALSDLTGAGVDSLRTRQ